MLTMYDASTRVCTSSFTCKHKYFVGVEHERPLKEDAKLCYQTNRDDFFVTIIIMKEGGMI